MDKNINKSLLWVKVFWKLGTFGQYSSTVFLKLKEVIKVSKIYAKYLELKEKNPNKLYLFKSGKFYIFIADDCDKNII